MIVFELKIVKILQLPQITQDPLCTSSRTDSHGKLLALSRKDANSTFKSACDSRKEREAKQTKHYVATSSTSIKLNFEDDFISSAIGPLCWSSIMSVLFIRSLFHRKSFKLPFLIQLNPFRNQGICQYMFNILC